MRMSSTVVSVTLHTALAIGLLQASTAGPQRGPRPIEFVDITPLAAGPVAPAAPFPHAPVIDGDNLALPRPYVPVLTAPTPGWGRAPDTGGRVLARDPPSGWSGGPVDARLAEEAPVLLVGPVPRYPELLRQAGIEGRVVLEAIVDTLGRVERGSMTVISGGGYPAFAAAAIEALGASLFRPARMQGRGVRVRVRVPFDFSLASGAGGPRRR